MFLCNGAPNQMQNIKSSSELDPDTTNIEYCLLRGPSPVLLQGFDFMKIFIACFSCLDRSEKSKRRTKTVNNTNNPTWNQSFVYSPIRSSELDSRNLEVTVWDFDRFGANDFLGEVVIELQQSVITEV